MSEFFYLIPLSLLMGFAGLGVFLWSLRARQYEDLDGAAERILLSVDLPPQRTVRRAEPPGASPVENGRKVANGGGESTHGVQT